MVPFVMSFVISPKIRSYLTLALVTVTYCAMSTSIMSVTTVLPQFFRDEHIFNFTVDQQFMNDCLQGFNNATVNKTCLTSAPLDARKYGGESFYNGLLFSFSAIVQLLTLVIVERLLNLFGSTYTTLITLPLMLAGSILMCLLNSFVGLSIARILQALGMQQLSFILIVTELYKNDVHMRQVGFSIIYTGFAVGSFLMPSFAGYLYTNGGKTLAFGVIAAFQAVLLPLWFLEYKTSNLQKGTNSQSSENEDNKENQLGYFTLLNDRKFIAILFYLMISFVSSSYIEPQLSNLMHSIDETLTQEEIGLLYVAAFIGYVLGGVICTTLTKHWPNHRWAIMHVFTGLIAVSCMLIAYVNSYLQMFLGLLLLTTGQAVVDEIGIPLSFDHVNAKHKHMDNSLSRSRISCIQGVCYLCGYIIGSLGGGVIVELISMRSMSIAVAGLNVGTIIIAMWANGSSKQ